MDCFGEGDLGWTYKREHNLKVGESDEGIIFEIVSFK